MSETQWTANALRVLEARYLLRDAAGELAEDPSELLHRVARGVAAAERRYGGTRQAERWEAGFYEAMRSLDFLPNTPTLMNAGTRMGQLSACFVLPVEDSMREIFESLTLMALIQQSGGGTGFAFSRLRQRGSIVGSSGGAASGPVSFMRIFDTATENIQQGGRRRGANMAVLRVDHPDILEFVEAKLDGRSLRNFNLSVGVTDSFMEAAADDKPFELCDPRTRGAVATVSSAELLDRIAAAAWRCGDPGMVFLDTTNRSHPLLALGPIEATNPCGEVPLLPYEACNLGSINLGHMVCNTSAGPAIDWDKLARTAHLGMRMLDDIVEVGRWPDPRIREMAHNNRKVGLGVMGFAELLIHLGVPYASAEAVRIAEELMGFLLQRAREASAELAQERGVFNNWEKSTHRGQGTHLRNATCTAIAPTGTISCLAGTSASIEPLFALAYRRQHVLGNQTLQELNPLFLSHARQQGFLTEELVHDLQERGNLSSLAGVPDRAKQLFQTALEIDPEDHLRVQAAFQRHVDNAVSKTVNLPAESSPNAVADIYRRGWELGLKGITVYRYGSKGQQVLQLGSDETPEGYEHFARCDPDACSL